MKSRKVIARCWALCTAFSYMLKVTLIIFFIIHCRQKWCIGTNVFNLHNDRVLCMWTCGFCRKLEVHFVVALLCAPAVAQAVANILVQEPCWKEWSWDQIFAWYLVRWEGCIHAPGVGGVLFKFQTYKKLQLTFFLGGADMVIFLSYDREKKKEDRDSSWSSVTADIVSSLTTRLLRAEITLEMASIKMLKDVAFTFSLMCHVVSHPARVCQPIR